MPEGDAVLRAAQRLHAGLAGQVLRVAELRWGELGDVRLVGARTVEVVSRGKHLLHRLDDGRTLHTHLRMEGRWRVRPVARVTAAQRRSPDLRVLLATSERAALGTRLGMVDVVPTAQEERLVGHLGPDLLGPDWDEDEAVRRLAGAGDVPVATALLDQRNLAGLGTIYTSEPLFLERLSPWTPTSELDARRLHDLVGRARRLLLMGAREPDPAFTGDPRDPTYVFGRRGRPCRRCGGAVRMAPVGEAPRARLLAYCPRCQGGLAPTDDGKPQTPLGAPAAAGRPARSGGGGDRGAARRRGNR